MSEPLAEGLRAYQTPPPDANRMGTCDLTDKYCPDPVDKTVQNPVVQIMQAGIFRCVCWGLACDGRWGMAIRM